MGGSTHGTALRPTVATARHGRLRLGTAPQSLEAAALTAVRLYCLVPSGGQPRGEGVWGPPSALSMASPR